MADKTAKIMGGFGMGNTNQKVSQVGKLGKTPITLPNYSGMQKKINDGVITTPEDDPIFLALSGPFIRTNTANYVTLTNDSMADALHRHSELSASDGTPNPALSVDASGNVGIGTTAPTSILHVNSNVAPGTAGIARFMNDYASTYSDASPGDFMMLGSRFTGQASTWGVAKLKWGHADTYQNNGGRFAIDLINTAGGYSNVMTMQSTGNVGIGTTSPDYKLDVNGQIGLASHLATRTSQIEFSNYNSTTTPWMGFPASTNTMYFRPEGSGKWGFYSDGTGGSVLTMQSDGNVGIGTTGPLDKLHIEGDYPVSTRVSESTYIYTKYGAREILSHADVSQSKDFTISQESGTAATGRIIFQTGTEGNLAPRMTILQAGNVGIGTTDVDSLLHIYGAGAANPTLITDIDQASIFLENSGGGTTGSTVGIFGSQAGDLGLSSGVGFGRESSANWGSDIRFYTHKTATADISQITERMRIDASGNVGIGTTDPLAKLHMQDSVNGTVSLKIANRWGTASQATEALSFLGYRDVSLNHVVADIKAINKQSGAFGDVVHIADLAFFTLNDANAAASPPATTEKMRITSEGNVGIGTTAPNQKLQVSGIINASYNKIVGVATPVDDYDAANKAYVDAISNTPAGWTCTVRSADSSSQSGEAGASVSCSGNEKVVSGGCKDAGGASVVLLENYPTNQGWYCQSYDSGTRIVTAYANCCT